MATDGPVTPEQGAPPPPTGEQKGKGLFGFRRGGEAKPAAAPQTPPRKEALSGKMDKVMAELKKKDQELEGNLIAEHGEGEAKFFVLQHPLRNEGDKFTSTYRWADRKTSNDWLLVTKDGFKILRVKTGTLKNSNQEYQEAHPGEHPTLERSTSDRIFPDVIDKLAREGTTEFKSKFVTRPEGSGYYIDPKSPGAPFEVKFGGGRSLQFQPDGGMHTGAYRILAEQFAKGVYPDMYERQRDLAEATGSNSANLILSPDAAEIAEIIKYNIEEAKRTKDEKETKKLQDEAKILAEKKKEEDQAAQVKTAEDDKRRQQQEKIAAQNQAADSALDLLGKL